MNRVIEEKRRELERVCPRRHVRRIELFGSATRPDFDPASSDLDFLVSFEDLDRNRYADTHFGLLQDLQKATGGFGSGILHPEPLFSPGS